MAIMTVFTTLFFTSPWNKALRVHGLLLRNAFIAVCLTFAWCLQSWAQGVEEAQVSLFKLERNADGIYVSAQVQFQLPQAVEDALQKGIPVYFVAQCELQQERWYWYNRSVSEAQRSMRLSYQPLTRRWRLNVSHGAPNDMNLSQSMNQNFESLDEALASIRRFTRWRVADTQSVDSDARLELRFNFRLDLDKLPRPFQIGNFGQADWMIETTARATVPAEISK